MTHPEEISQIVVQFLREKQAYETLPAVVDALNREIYHNHDIHVTVAIPLTEAEEATLKTTLEQKWGKHRTLVSTDPALLSGMVISFNGTTIDTSGLSRLRTLQQSLT